LGCWIDGSHISALLFDIDVVETAIHFGYEINIYDWRELKRLCNTSNDSQPLEDMAEVAKEAYDWLDNNLPEGYYFDIKDNSLFLQHEDLELIND
jgi:L-arabinose isomerase